jgi:hypothetical protein
MDVKQHIAQIVTTIIHAQIHILPIRFERKDCMDSIGCNELMGGEQVKVKGLDKEGHVEIYKFDGPTYIPGIV